jgi:hypothetical protein
VEKKEISGYGEGNYFFGSGNTGQDIVVEYKCPWKHRDQPPKEA